MRNPINIIGAGMAGSILAKLLRIEGIKFRLFDAGKPGAASQVSENLIGINWYKSQKELVRESLSILKSIVPVRIIEAGNNTAHHVFTSELLEEPAYKTEVSRIDKCGLTTSSGDYFPGFNIVCAGIWSRLLTTVDVQGYVGHGFIFQKPTPTEWIKPYKPFRFEKLINRTPNETWYSNSLSVTTKTYAENKERYIQELAADSEKIANLNLGVGVYAHGIRPLTASHNNIMIDGGMVITGGYKSGMLYYPIQCQSAVNWIKNQQQFL